MKKFQNIIKTGLALSIFTIVISCGSSKACNDKLVAKDCPTDGKCSVVIHKDKAMVIKTDEFGKPHYEMEDNATKNVVIYTYNRNVPKDVQDGSYREVIVLELNKNQQSFSFTGKPSKTPTNALFGRFCYCKGSTGYYKITEGNLTLSDPENQNYTMDFRITEVPQVIQKIQFSVK